MKTVREVIGCGHAEGEVGLEIEVETEAPFTISSLEVAKLWKLTSDGSLKGYSGEFVLRNPLTYPMAMKSLNNLKVDLFKTQGAKMRETVRAGVHVHINVQQMTVPEVMKFALLYYCLETPLTKFCGENRVGNLFCLRFRDAEYLSFVLRGLFTRNKLLNLRTDDLRYSALNYNSLFKFGSLEFRAMETKPGFDGIEDWVSILLLLKEASMKIEDLTTIGGEISELGPEGWAKKILGQKYFDMLKYDGMEQDIMYDFREVQEFTYLFKNFEGFYKEK